MTIRRANEKDIPKIIDLLGQVLEIHAEIRPDIFIPGTTKYTDEELLEMLKDGSKPIYVAADENDICVGYAFCQSQPISRPNLTDARANKRRKLSLKKKRQIS